MTVNPPPHDLLARQDLTLDELVQHAERLLRELAPEQTRYRVTDRPDARTVRYYVTQRLLPRPVSYEGGRARYSGSHLLRLLLIKRLQTEHHTLRHIRTLLAAEDDALLERFFSAAAATTDTQPHPASVPPPATALALQRFALPAGGSVDLPQKLLNDRAARQELAEALETLAAQLRRPTKPQ